IEHHLCKNGYSIGLLPGIIILSLAFLLVLLFLCFGNPSTDAERQMGKVNLCLRRIIIPGKRPIE
ncbi:MAG: hypothetical protein AAFR42_14470, partial [Cyanobacteria bacterium J06628_6]